jgi:hypothetical protein
MSEAEFEAYLESNARHTAMHVVLDNMIEVQRMHAKNVSFRKIAEYVTRVSGKRVTSATVDKVISQPGIQETVALEIDLIAQKRRIRDYIENQIATGGRITKASLRRLTDDEQALTLDRQAKAFRKPDMKPASVVTESSPSRAPATPEVVTERKAPESGKLSLAERARISEKNENAPPPRSNLWSRKIDDGAQQR